MPSNGSRHNDEALGRAGNSGSGNDGRGEGESLSPDRQAQDRQASEQAGPRVRDLRASRDTSTPGVAAGGNAQNADISDFADIAEVIDAEIVDVIELDSVMKERDELLDTLKRTLADFDNYRKRVDRQSAELRDRANERIVEALLPALDAFSLARAHLGDGQSPPEVRVLLQAASLFEDALHKEGLTRIEAEGAPFDPVSHDAVEHVPADETGPGSVPSTGDATSVTGPVVTDVLRPGYLWKGRVIRPAMVRVRG